MSEDIRRAWSTLGTLSARFYASGATAEAVVADSWFAALSRTKSAELNVCGLAPGATTTTTTELIRILGPDQPGIVFTSEHVSQGCRDLLESAQFEVTEVAEPLMRCVRPPVPAPTGFVVARTRNDSDIAAAVALISEAHSVDFGLLDETLAEAVRSDLAQVWLAWDGDQPVSTVCLCTTEEGIGVMEMMTPPGHQGRGAGRGLLTAALGATWSTATADAVLLATPAGRRLYESIGFEAVDESFTFYRGLEASVLEAIGQPPGGQRTT